MLEKPNSKPEELQEEEQLAKFLTYSSGALLAFEIVTLQVILSLPKLDIPLFIALICYSFSIPLLSTAIIIIQVSMLRKLNFFFHKVSTFYTIFFTGILGGFVGLVTAIWHITWIAGTIVILASTVMLVLISTYFNLFTDFD